MSRKGRSWGRISHPPGTGRLVTVFDVKNRPSALLSPTALWLALLVGALPALARAAEVPAQVPLQVPPQVLAQAQQLARDAAKAVAPAGAQVTTEAGALDARLRLAACQRVEPHLLPGQPAWGLVRVGLRCTAGAPWRVTLPVRVTVLAPAPVLRSALPAGATLVSEHLESQAVAWPAGASPLTDIAALAGRVLARPLAAGQPLRAADLQARQWFASGQTVRIVALGSGFSVRAEGQALAPGIEGQPVRVRTEAGRIVVGHASGPAEVQVAL
jgi:flagellar basal body P-ring formation protein FlgA